MDVRVRTFGVQLRDWRVRRRLSQLSLACDAEISARHLSFLETGRSAPSRDMVLHLAEKLDVPMRERNAMLVAAGYAPVFPERALNDPVLRAAHDAIQIVLEGHKPFPAFAVDRHWNVVASNRALEPMYEGVAEHLLRPPVHALRLCLHPDGLASRTLNLPEWRAHLLGRLRQQVDHTGDAALSELHDELAAYPCPPTAGAFTDVPGIVVPFRILVRGKLLSFFSTTTVFGTPIDVTLSEIALECFYPTDRETDERVRALGG
jgi:transcriptional regulator with XRE-family HTH domain